MSAGAGLGVASPAAGPGTRAHLGCLRGAPTAPAAATLAGLSAAVALARPAGKPRLALRAGPRRRPGRPGRAGRTPLGVTAAGRAVRAAARASHQCHPASP
ncbi:hypothetical protein HBB16_01060 [Pseudonocardia sp. MCCB 268]|nr:hypothetical protein [Pseudonocardia cytotoxica]